MSTTDYKTMSRQVWREIREGTPFQQSLPEVSNNYSSDFYGINEGEDIDYEALADFIFDCEKDCSLVFDWKKFARQPEKAWVKVKTGDGFQDRLITIPNAIPFKYTNDNKQEITTKITGKINRRIDYLEDYWAYYINIILEKKKIEASIKILYDNTKQYIVDAVDTLEKGDFRIDEKYIAIVLTAENLLDFIFLVKDTVGKQYVPHLKELIAEKYCKKIKESKDSSQLNFLYENAPEFVLNELHNYMDYDAIFNHIIQLSDYDDKGCLSWFKDSSGALINCLKAIGNSTLLFNNFSDDLALVKRIFYNLDGLSEFNGEILPNKIIFASLLNALANFHAKDKNTKARFYINGGYKIGSNAVFESSTEKEKNTFYLNQEKINIQPVVLPGGSVLITEYDTDVNNGGYYNPFDFVTLTEFNNGEEISYPVIALLAKAIAQEEEIKEIQFITRIGLDALAIIIGLATLGSGTALGLALVEIGMATGDIMVALKEEELMQTEEGRAFLGAWNAVLLTGAAFATPQLLQTVFKSGSKLIKSAATAGKANVVNAVKASLLKILLEIEIANFSKDTLKIIEPNDLFLGFEYQSMANRMADAGVLFVSGQKEGKLIEYYAAVYKGEVIEEFTKATKSKFAEKYWRLDTKNIVESCEEIIKRRKIISVKDLSLLGKLPNKGVKIFIDLIDEFGNNIGQLSRSPNGNELYYKLVQRGKEIDIKCYMKLLDDKYKLNGLPIKNGEHLLYGDFNIPKEITDKMSGLGQIIYEDGLKYFLNAKKYGKVDGTVSIWIKADAYNDYGGQSINLEQFWKAYDSGMSYEKAAFETFAGKQALKNGFTKVRILDDEKITRTLVELNFLN